MKKKVGISLTVLLVLYGLWNGRNLILGPRITIEAPTDGQSFDRALVTVKGTAKNISFISLNGRQIFIDENGLFTEDIALLPGYNILELRGKDRFGKEKVAQLRVYNTEKEASLEIPPPGSTTTVSTSTEITN